jgi:4-amino-4-deoxy-L-arabinose transferase-like glycosyltransferase
MRRPKLERYAEALILLGLAAACYILFFHRLGEMGLIGPDEPRYAAVAREMYLSGDYITPRLQGMPWLEKPPLMYWGASLGYALFGINEWGARFPAAFSATIAVFGVYGICRRLWSRTHALCAALVMASSVGFFAYARAASTDMPLTACLTLALGFFLIAYSSPEPSRRWWLYGFYALLGLGSLAKGPIALALPAISVAAFLTVQRQWREWRSFHPEGALIALLVAAPWYVACTWVNGYEFIEFFFVNQNVQ